jgi:hypothetical protein
MLINWYICFFDIKCVCVLLGQPCFLRQRFLSLGTGLHSAGVASLLCRCIASHSRDGMYSASAARGAALSHIRSSDGAHTRIAVKRPVEEFSASALPIASADPKPPAKRSRGRQAAFPKQIPESTTLTVADGQTVHAESMNVHDAAPCDAPFTDAALKSWRIALSKDGYLAIENVVPREIIWRARSVIVQQLRQRGLVQQMEGEGECEANSEAALRNPWSTKAVDPMAPTNLLDESATQQ